MAKYTWGVAAMLLWGAAPVVLKTLAAQLPGLWVMTVVYSVAACVTLPWVLGALRQGGVSGGAWIKVALVGILLTSCFNLLAAIAAPSVKGTTLGAIIALEPLMVAAIAAIMARRWLSWSTSLALVVSLLGAWFLVASPGGGTDAGQNALWAVLLVILGAMLWSLAVVLAGRLQLPWKPLQTSMIMICAGSLPFLLLAPLLLKDGPGLAQAWSSSLLGGIVFMALGATVAANLLWLRSIRELGALANSLLINLGPLVTFALSATFLGESWGAWQTAGATLILAGLTWGAWQQHRSPAAPIPA